MRYYKLINNNEFVGIGTSLDMRRFQKEAWHFFLYATSLKLNTCNAMVRSIVLLGCCQQIPMQKKSL